MKKVRFFILFIRLVSPFMRGWIALAVISWGTVSYAEFETTDFISEVSKCYEAAVGPDDAQRCLFAAVNLCVNAENHAPNPNQAREWCLRAEARVWDNLLNREYADAVAFAQALDATEALPDLATRETDLRNAQRAWITYRDANCQMAFSKEQYTTLRWVDQGTCVLRMTALRSIGLRRYRDGFVQ